MQDVGKPKAVVAAQRVQERVAGVTVTAHHCRIEDMPLSFYEEFTVIVLGLDSLEARRYMNGVACSLLRKHPAASSTSSRGAGISLSTLVDLSAAGTATRRPSSNRQPSA
jgi:molybdopterin/thiamine biosynthesis adenylyltransferase